MPVKEMNHRSQPKSRHQRTNSNHTTCQIADQRTEHIIGHSVPEIRNLRPSLCHDQGKAIIRCNSLIRHLIHRQAQTTNHNTNAQCHQSNRQSCKLQSKHSRINIIKERSNISQAHRIHNSSNSQESSAKSNLNDQ